MRTAEIFDGKRLITVSENQTFRLDGVWNWDIGTTVTFQVKRGIEVETTVKSKDGTGSQFIVTKIKASDEIAEMSVEAEDVEEVETTSIPKSDVKFLKKKFTKKDLIDFINENNLDIEYKNMTKVELVNVLTELNYI